MDLARQEPAKTRRAQSSAGPSKSRPESTYHENRKRDHIGDQTVCSGLHGEELVVCAFHGGTSSSRDGGDTLELPSGGPDRLQSAGRAALSAALRDLSRSTASSDIAGFAAGRGVDEGLWNPDPKPQHSLEKLSQPSSRSQFEAAWFAYRLLSDNDQGAVLEVIEGHAI